MGRDEVVSMFVWIGFVAGVALFSSHSLLSWSHEGRMKTETYDGIAHRRPKEAASNFFKRSLKTALGQSRHSLLSQTCILGIAHLHGGKVTEEAIDGIPATSQ